MYNLTIYAVAEAFKLTLIQSFVSVDLSEVDSLNDNDHKDTKSVEMSPLAAHVLNWKRGVRF